MTLRTTLTSLLVVIAVLAVVLLLLPGKQLEMTSPAATSTPVISAATSTITASTTDYTVEANYPQFGIASIDSQIKSDVESGITDLETQAETDQPAANNFPQYDFNSTFDSVYIGPHYISTRIILSQYTGGAHELSFIIGATFHRDTGVSVTLDEALALTGMTLDELASSSKVQLAENPDTAPTGIWTQGSDPTPDNYKNFLINENSVIFIFQPYQVAPYSAGAPEILIPRIR